MREVRQDRQQFRDADLATKSLRMTIQANASLDAKHTQMMMGIVTDAVKMVSSGTSLGNNESLAEQLGPGTTNKFVNEMASKGSAAEMLNTEVGDGVLARHMMPELGIGEAQELLDSGALSKEELALGILDQKVPGASVFGGAEKYMDLGDKLNEESLKNQAEAAQKMPKDAAKSEHAAKNMQEIASHLRALLSGLLRG
jgi:hypothetical protein